MPTVRGTISVDLQRNGDTIRYSVSLPDGVTGVLVAADGQEHPLTSGDNMVEASSN